MAITSANQLELLQTAEAVAREKMIDPDLVIQAMEDSLARAAKSRYGAEMDIRVKIDPKTGDQRYDDPALFLPWGTKPEGYCRNYDTPCPWRFDPNPPSWSPEREAPRGRDYFGGDLKGVVDLGYRIAVARPPSESERDVALAFLQDDPARLKGLAWLLFNLDEFLFAR